MKHTIKKTSAREAWCGFCLTGARAWKKLPIAWYCEICSVPTCLRCVDSTQCQGKNTRRNPEHDYEDGVEIYTEFHQYAPNEAGKFPGTLKIPESVYLAGSAEWIFYASKKWEKKQNFYLHEHGWGVKTYLTDGGYTKIDVPDRIRRAKTLVRLGECRGGPATLPEKLTDIGKNIGRSANSGKGLGFVWSRDGELDGAIVGSPYPELYCTPDGKCLLVIEGKKKIRALIYGGGMHVRPEGIVG